MLFDFSKQRRLRKQADFKRVFENPRVLNTPYVRLFFRQNALKYARVGVALKRQHLSRATERNLVKRIVRESFRLAPLGEVGVDVVVLARKHIQRADNRGLRQCLERAWQELAASSER